MSYTYSFEKLEVWQNAVKMSKSVYKLTEDFPKEELNNTVSQIRRCTLSISTNLAEGATRTSYREKLRFFQIAYSSCIEGISLLRISMELGFCSEENYTKFRNGYEQLTRMINKLQKNTQGYEAKSNPLNPLTSLPKEPKPLNLPDRSPAAKAFGDGRQVSPSTSKLEKEFFIHPSSIVEEGAQIGAGTKVWHFCHIMKATIGEGCSFGQNVFVADDVIIGNNVKVQNNVSIYKGVICEDDVFLGPSMVLTNVINPRSGVNRQGEYSTTRIKKGASIGANATIVCGNTIGRYSFIGAGAVITKDVEDYALMVGNPARQKGWMSEHGTRLNFDDNGLAICAGSKEKYILNKGIVKKTV